MAPAALALLAGLLFVKEAGLPVPVPGDLLVLGAGVATSGHAPAAGLALASILVAGYLGGGVQFLLVRGALRGPQLRLLARLGVPPARLEELAERLRAGGARSVAVARATPGIRVATIAASGLAALPFGAFMRGLVAGNSVFVGGHFALGFVIGAPALGVAAALASPAAAVVALVVLSLVGAAGWLALRRRGSGTREEAVLAPIASWADAACPACLTLAALGAAEVAETRADRA